MGKPSESCDRLILSHAALFPSFSLLGGGEGVF